MTFQDLILTLQHHWAAQGCILAQAYDLEVGAGTMAPTTFLRALGPEPWNVAYVQPSRRPADGRFGENPNRLFQHHQFQVILKPAPKDVQELYLDSLRAFGIDPLEHDLRFVEDDWESPTLGAWGLGWEVWCDGMEITQFTYFQQCGGFECRPVSAELTYGLERIAMYLQNVESIFDVEWVKGVTLRRGLPPQRGGDEHLRLPGLGPGGCSSRSSRSYEKECKRLIGAGAAAAGLRLRAEVLAHLQPARRARGDLRHRARRVHQAGAGQRPRLRRGLPQDARASWASRW